MALDKCKECGQEVSQKAGICPKCGAPIKKKTSLFTWIVTIFVGVWFIVFLSSQSNSPTGTSSSSSPASSTPKKGKSIEVSQATIKPPIGYTFNGYTLNDREKTVLKAMLLDDFNGYIDGKETLVPIWQYQLSTIVTVNVTADRLQRDYESNEVAGDQKYMGRTMLISGVVDSINRGIGKNYYLSLVGGSNMFTKPHASLADGYEDYLANLNKGQVVHLVCKGNGMFMGSASVSKCEPINIFADKIVTDCIKSLFNQSSKEDKLLPVMVFMSIAVASNLRDSSDCFGTDSDNNKCMTEISNIIKEIKTDKSKLKVVSEKIKIDLPILKGDLNLPAERPTTPKETE